MNECLISKVASTSIVDGRILTCPCRRRRNLPNTN